MINHCLYYRISYLFKQAIFYYVTPKHVLTDYFLAEPQFQQTALSNAKQTEKETHFTYNNSCHW